VYRPLFSTLDMCWRRPPSPLLHFVCTLFNHLRRSFWCTFFLLNVLFQESFTRFIPFAKFLLEDSLFIRRVPFFSFPSLFPAMTDSRAHCLTFPGGFPPCYNCRFISSSLPPRDASSSFPYELILTGEHPIPLAPDK